MLTAVRWTLTLCLLLSTAALSAAPERTRKSSAVRLSLTEALRRGQRAAPELRLLEARRRQEAELGRVASAWLQQPPHLELSAGPRLFPGSQGAGLDVSASLLQDFSLRGARGSRRAWAAARRRQLDTQRAVAQRELGTRAARAWLDAWLARAHYAVREAELKTCQELLRIAAARVRAGRSAPTDEALARALVAEARAELLRAEGQQIDADAALRYATGLAPDAPLALHGRLARREGSFEEQRLLAQAERAHPKVQLADGSAAVHRQAAHLAHAESGPWLSFGPSVAREGTGDVVVQAQLGLGLPFVEPQALEVAAARVEAAEAEAERARSRREAAQDALLAMHEQEHALEALDGLEREALPAAQEALRIATRQFELGSGELSATLEARRVLLELELRRATALMNVNESWIHLWWLTGDARYLP